MPFVERDGVRIYTERRGSGEPLLYISGTGADLRVHPNAFDTPLAHRFDLLAYDQRGLGQSDQPEGPYSMADYADDAAAVLDAVEVADTCVIGVSFGGMVAQELALRHPDRVRRLVLACTSSGGAGGASYPLHEIAGLEPTARAAIMLGIIDTRWRDPDFVDAARDNAVRALARATGGPTPGSLRQLEARSRHDTYERLGEIACAVLVCAGRYDAIAPPANAAALARAIATARLELFEGGHGFLNQDPAAFGAIADFLSEPG